MQSCLAIASVGFLTARYGPCFPDSKSTTTPRAPFTRPRATSKFFVSMTLKIQASSSKAGVKKGLCKIKWFLWEHTHVRAHTPELPL